MTRPTAVAMWLLAGAVLASCSRNRAEFGPERAVPKERPVTLGQSTRERLGLGGFSGGAGHENQTAADDGAVHVDATLPQNWQSQPADPGMFKDVRWFIDGDRATECYLTARSVGPIDMNLTRWFGQFGLPVMSVSEFLAQPLYELLGAPATLLEIEGTLRGTPGMKTLILVRRDGDTIALTLRLNGTKEKVDRERDNFLAVAKSMRQGSGGGSTGQPSAARTAPQDTDPMGPPPGHGSDPSSAPARFTATIPADWKPTGDTGSRQLRHGFGTNGEVYVGELGGSVQDNLGIWCFDIGGKAPDEAAIAALPRVPMLGDQGVLLDLSGDYSGGIAGQPIPGARLLVAAHQSGNGVVFVKCVGPAAEVEKTRDGFLKFCATLARKP